MDDQEMNVDQQGDEMEETGAMPPEHTAGHTSSGDEADVADVNEDDMEDEEDDDTTS